MKIVGVWFISAADIAAIWKGPKRSEVEAEPQRSEGTCLTRIIQVRAAFCRGADLGAALAAERLLLRDADTGWGCGGR